MKANLERKRVLFSRWQKSVFRTNQNHFMKKLSILMLVLVMAFPMSASGASLSGDVNGDGNVNITDVSDLIDYMLSNDASLIVLENADVDADGHVNIADVSDLIDMLLNPHQLGSLAISPTYIDFGVVELGTDKTDAFTVTNTGTGTLIFKIADDDVLGGTFEIPESGVEHSLAPGASMNCTVISQGLATSWSADADVIITSNADNGNQMVNLHVIGVDNEPLITESEIYMQVGETRTLDVRTDSYMIINGNEEVVMATRGGGTVSGSGGRYISYTWSIGHIVLNALTSGSATVRVSDTQTGKNCVLTIHVGDVEPNNYEYVDLGLPSGTLWATCNVGANAPEEYGDYFAWGETAPKDYYDWSTYKWCNSAYNQLTKYCIESSYGYNGFVDNKMVLDPEDDAAYVNWGSSWRMPTSEQQRELINNCTWQRTQLNGVNGRLVTGPNGNTMFLPAAGIRRGDTLSDAGPSGYYWSRELNQNNTDNAYSLDFHSYGVYWYHIYARNDGLAVRAVRVSQN